MATESIKTLVNGTIFFVQTNNFIGHLFPPFVYQSLGGEEFVRIVDTFNNVLKIDTTIDTINGVVFIGGLAQLQTDISNAVDDANTTFENFNSAVASGSATAAKQDEQITELQNIISAIGSVVSSNNSTSTPLNNAAVFTGTADDVSKYNNVVFSCKTDQSGILTAEFSTNGTNWDSVLTYKVDANLNEAHRLTVSKKYFRVTFTNNSGSNQTYLRLQTIFGSQGALTSPLNSVIQSDADAIITRPLDFNIAVADGLYQNRNVTIKDGLITAIGNGNVTRDVTNEASGAYAGFPTGAVENGEIVVSGADTGTVFYSYLASSSDTDYTFGSKAITGAGTYSLGHNVWRSNFAYFVSSSATSFNVGNITLRNTTTTTNVFWRIDAGIGQTYCAAYTVPSGSSIYFDRFNGNVKGSTSGTLDGYFWYRANGESPRLRFPFELQFGTLFFDDVDYLIKVPEKVDFIPRITESSANGLSAKFSYRIMKVKS